MSPLACSVCFGNPNSALTKGALAATLFLLAVVLTVLAGIAITIFVWSRRAHQSQLAEPYQ